MVYFTILLLQSLVDDPGLSIIEFKGNVSITCQMTQVCINEFQGHLCITSYGISRNINQSEIEHFILKIQYCILPRCNFNHFSSPVVVVNFSHFHLLLHNHWANFNQTWHKISGMHGNQVWSNKGPRSFQMGDNNKIAKIH